MTLLPFVFCVVSLADLIMDILNCENTKERLVQRYKTTPEFAGILAATTHSIRNAKNGTAPLPSK